MAGTIGNQNSSKTNRLWGETIKRAALHNDAEKLRKIADKLLDLAADGDMSAIKEFGDRFDGKATQAIDLGSDPDRPMIQKLVREIVRPDHKDG